MNRVTVMFIHQFDNVSFLNSICEKVCSEEGDLIVLMAKWPPKNHRHISPMMSIKYDIISHLILLNDLHL